MLIQDYFEIQQNSHYKRNIKVENLKSELNQVSNDSNKLQNESKIVVESFNKWVRDQKEKNKENEQSIKEINDENL